MSDVDDDKDGNGDGDEKAPKTLREQNSKLNEQNQTLQQQLASLLEKDRSRTIADCLRDKGANPKLAKHIARDIEGDVTAESVEKWLADEGDAFGFKPNAESGSDEESGDGEGADEVDEQTGVQAQRISMASGSAPSMPTGWTPDRMAKASNQQLLDAGILEPK